VALRVAAHGGRIVLDLGSPDGRAVLVGPEGWEVVETSPVLFRRTALTAVLPEPIRDGDLSGLRETLNVTDDSWALAVGYMVAALFPHIAHPILLVGGQQGTGKTLGAGLIAGVVDPGTVENHNAPRDPESWAMAASGSWCVTVDNVSSI